MAVMAMMVAESEAWHRVILQAYEALTAADLSSPEKVHLLPVPTRFTNSRSFSDDLFYMLGRKKFEQLLHFARQLMQPSKLPKVTLPEGVPFAARTGRRGYILGTRGEGKSYMLAALSGFLHAEGTSVVVYLSAAALSYPALRSSLLLAFARDQDAGAELQTIQDELLLSWLAERPRLLILVDDFNDLDAGHQRQQPNWRNELDALSEVHVVLFCSSCSSWTLPDLASFRRERCFLIAGGFSPVEFEKFCEVFMGGPLEERVYYSTGRNPRLLSMHRDGQLDAVLAGLRRSLLEFLDNLSHTDRQEFVAQLAGAAVKEPLPKAMNSRCFYVRESETAESSPSPSGVQAGTLEAICDNLMGVALHQCAVHARGLQWPAVEQQIKTFTAGLSSGNITRVGWNAAQATLLLLGALPVDIQVGGRQLKNWLFRAESVAYSGGIKAAALEGCGRQVLHLPVEFGSKALDAIIEGAAGGMSLVAGLQISVNKDPHEGCIEEFCRVIENKGYDKRLFIWIGHFPLASDLSRRKVKVGTVGVRELTISFKFLHPLLAPIDDVCAAAREGQVRRGERVQCAARTVAGSQCRLTVRRDSGQDRCHIHRS